MLRGLDGHQLAIAHHSIAIWHPQATRAFPTLRMRPLAFIGLPLFLCISLARAAPPMLPKGGHFVAGSGSIADGGQSVTITQTSARGIVDWCYFSIGSGRTVIFDNGSGATLNRITGSDASVILGRLSATGSVYLINPQGVVIGPGGVVATGGRFVASSLNADNNAFMAGGSLTFSGGGNGVVVNLGKIGSSGADVILVSRTAVINAGEIDAAKGTAELAAGNQVLLQDSAGSRQVFVQTGSKGDAMNAGAIRAAQVSLQAADGNVYALAGNSAAIRATGTATRDGHVWLVADKGAVHANGAIEAADSSGSGGTVETLANKLDVGGATVQAGDWKLSAPNLTVDHSTANTLSRSLSKGTSVDAEANGTNGAAGDLTLKGNVNWTGDASLTLGAAHNVTITSKSTVSNTGVGNLRLRADAYGVDNAGGVSNRGTIDWSKSKGIVSALYDMNGSYTAGKIVSNSDWTAAPYSGEVAQVSAFKLVNSAADLMKISQDLKGNYALGKDIDLKATEGESFSPIAPSVTAPFAGQFDGFGHLLSNLNISVPYGSSSAYVGLFGVIGTSGVVRNLGIANAHVEGANGGVYGALAGRNDGYIAYAWSTGEVASGPGPTYAGIVGGGLVGWNKGTIERSWSGASLGGYGDYGGLVGENNGLIAQSFTTGTVATGSHAAGAGFVYYNAGLVRQSYATGPVYTMVQDGSFAVWNTETGVIEESFTVGKTAQQPFPNTYGAIAGSNSGTIRNTVYWNKETTNRLNAVGNGGDSPAPPTTNGLTTAQMSTPASFVGWNFGKGGLWTMPAGATHPILQWQTAPN
ncbi:filamentous hemagglutinin N-terminal domain-containing protein [Caballeronia zhejiangensis]|uniref:two-partner secretion domain-containing protein n=1 Tax=Caballeronia zhejiangensis TaxID=871203 RepID=UPI001FD18D96|nr:filamentous hemagglutinin N-terminal domain-containing protein [Caballeronia zhejiangensis]